MLLSPLFLNSAEELLEVVPRIVVSNHRTKYSRRAVFQSYRSAYCLTIFYYKFGNFV